MGAIFSDNMNFLNVYLEIEKFLLILAELTLIWIDLTFRVPVADFVPDHDNSLIFMK